MNKKDFNRLFKCGDINVLLGSELCTVWYNKGDLDDADDDDTVLKVCAIDGESGLSYSYCFTKDAWLDAKPSDDELQLVITGESGIEVRLEFEYCERVNLAHIDYRDCD